MVSNKHKRPLLQVRIWWLLFSQLYLSNPDAICSKTELKEANSSCLLGSTLLALFVLTHLLLLALASLFKANTSCIAQALINFLPKSRTVLTVCKDQVLLLTKIIQAEEAWIRNFSTRQSILFCLNINKKISSFWEGQREKEDFCEKNAFSLITLAKKKTYCVHMVLFLPAAEGYSYIEFSALFS